MSGLRKIYLGLTIIGALVPGYYILRAFSEQGVAAILSIWVGGDNISRGLWLELVIVGLVLTVFVVSESIVRRDRLVLWCLPATVLLGASFGFPLYMFLRTRNA